MRLTILLVFDASLVCEKSNFSGRQRRQNFSQNLLFGGIQKGTPLLILVRFESQKSEVLFYFIFLFFGYFLERSLGP